jgi:hypothetical protein
MYWHQGRTVGRPSRLCRPSPCLVRRADLSRSGRGGSARRSPAKDARSSCCASLGSCLDVSLCTGRSKVLAQPREWRLQDECSALAAGRVGQVGPLGAGLGVGQQAESVLQAGVRLRGYVASKGSGLAQRRLNALLSAGSLSVSVNTAQTASRSSSLRTFSEPVLPSTTARPIDTATSAKPFSRSLRASSSTCSGARRTKEQSRHRTVSK